MMTTMRSDRPAVRKTIAHLQDASRLIARQMHDLPPVIARLEDAGALLDAHQTAVSTLKDDYTARIDDIIEQHTL